MFTPRENLAIKAMVGHAFRAPSPSELGANNTLTNTSNINGLQPETLQTAELAVDWIINPNLDWRTNVFHNQFNDEIGFSTSGANLTNNLYSLTTEGLESELLFGYAHWRGFANLSYAKRVNEQILDPGIAPSPNQLTWAPALMYKLGVTYTAGPVVSALSAYCQSATNRRASDLGLQAVPFSGGDLDVSEYRPNVLPGWCTVNAKVTWYVTPHSSLAAYATNLMNTQTNKMIQPGAFPFDYQGDGRVVGLVLKASF